MVIGKIFLTGAAEEQDLTVDLRGVTLVREAAITVLGVKRRQDSIVGKFKEIFIIAASRANKSIGNSWGRSRGHSAKKVKWSSFLFRD